MTSSGNTSCLLGKTWGYDDTGIWVSDGCSGEFVQGHATEQPEKKKPMEHIPNQGFLLYSGDEGEIYLRLFTYARYTNQLNLNRTYVDAFGNSHAVQRRQDVELTKFFSPFSGWFLTPKMRYYLYVWSNNAAQGQGAQTVGAGNISYAFNRFITFGAGITSLPSTRSTEGQFPYWLGVDDRLTSDEFFRGSYTSGIWFKGDLVSPKVKYMAMFADNLSILGVAASQLNNKFGTQSYMLQWLPTTGEFGYFGTFGDYDDHQNVAIRLGAHFTHSLEDKQSQPGTDTVENTQIRLTDGTIIFTPNIFGPGIAVENVTYRMTSLDAGIKWHGAALEGEYYRRWLNDFGGVHVDNLPQIVDHGFQLQSSAMVIQKTLQAYFSGGHVYGHYGSPSEVRGGVNWYFERKRGLRINAEWLRLEQSPVGYTAVPYQVGSDGNILSLNLELNF